MAYFPLLCGAPPRRHRRRLWLVAIVFLAVTGLWAAPTQADVNPVEQKARKAYAAADYQTAVDLFAQLYAETLHPTYLRNVGRCHQLMGNAERAITSFEEYLRKGDLDQAERTEIQGYIKEMEDLRKRQETALTADPGPEASTATPVANTLTAQPDSQKDDDGGLLTRWWFWTIVGAAAVAGGIAIVAAGGDGSSPACPPDRTSCK